ncbi:MAG: dimethylsulfonioproprionate lyase family protein [Pseudomonadota bacterium]
MDAPSLKESDTRLRDAILAFVAAHPDPAVGRFKAALADWGEDWRAAAPHHLPAADTLGQTLALSAPETRDLLALFVQERASRKWEQSYTRVDGVVGEDMLAGYGFAEVIGKQGPFVSTRVRAGIGVWGPQITYPAHRHQAEEVYVVLAGSAVFSLGEGERASSARQRAGTAVHVSPLLTHGFRTEDEPLAVFYLWQAGDLREKSSFS